MDENSPLSALLDCLTRHTGGVSSQGECLWEGAEGFIFKYDLLILVVVLMTMEK